MTKLKKRKKPAPKSNLSSENILELPFKELWEGIALELFPRQAKKLKLVAQVPVAEVVEFNSKKGQAITDQTIDFVCFDYGVTIEIQGATSKGRNGAHTSYNGVKRDYYKQLMLVLAGWVHLEFDNRMCKDKELISSVITQLVTETQVVNNPTEFDSWANNKTKRNRTTRQSKKLLKYLVGKSQLGTSTQIASSLKISVRAVKPIMLEEGWKQKTKQGKLIWFRDTTHDF